MLLVLFGTSSNDEQNSFEHALETRHLHCISVFKIKEIKEIYEIDLFFNLQMPFGIPDKSAVPLGISRKRAVFVNPNQENIRKNCFTVFHLIMNWSELNSFNYHTYIPFLWNHGVHIKILFSYNSYYKKKIMYKSANGNFCSLWRWKRKIIRSWWVYILILIMSYTCPFRQIWLFSILEACKHV